MCMSLEDCKIIAETLQGFFTSAAIVLGGIWTYFLFVKNRSKYPIINTNITYSKFSVTNGKLLIHVAVKLENHGLVLLQSDKAELRLRQVRPLPEDVLSNVNEDNDPVPEDGQEIPWELLREAKWNWENSTFEIEPKETDTLHADFIIDDDVEIMELYFYLNNSAKSRKQIGWTLTMMSDLTTTETSDE